MGRKGYGKVDGQVAKGGEEVCEEWKGRGMEGRV